MMMMGWMKKTKIVITENPIILLIDKYLIEIDTIRVSVVFLVVAKREEIGEVAKNLLIIEFRNYLRIQHKRND